MPEKCPNSGIDKAFCVCNPCQIERRRQARRGSSAPTSTVSPPPSVVGVDDGAKVDPRASTNAGLLTYGPSTKRPPGSYGKVLPARVLRFQGQPRIHFDPVKLRELADSIEADEQEQPATVRWLDNHPDYDCELIDGERRKLACEMKGLPLLVLVKEVLSLKQHFKMASVSNFHREDHTAFEIGLASKRLIEDGEKIRQVAIGFGYSVSYISQCLSLTELDPEVQALLHPDLPRDQSLRNVTAAALAKYPHAFQRTLAKEILAEGLGAVAALEHIRGRAKAEGIVAETPKSSVRHPNKDYHNHVSRVRMARTRLGLSEEMDTATKVAMFASRDPADHATVVEELKQLKEQTERLLKVFGELPLQKVPVT